MRRVRALAAPALLAAMLPPLALAELVDIEWSPANRFERGFTVAPGKFAELCGTLKQSSVVQWRFEGNAPSDFNIHYHVGKEVRTPTQQTQVKLLSGDFTAPLDQDYCWMWTNKGSAPLRLQVKLRR
ncbi:MAG: hypothetical protein RL341_2508 [Pseudomonadota bacterium]|jgi:hypothetical protein